jgi:hypothetical protein
MKYNAAETRVAVTRKTINLFLRCELGTLHPDTPVRIDEREAHCGYSFITDWQSLREKAGRYRAVKMLGKMVIAMYANDNKVTMTAVSQAAML